MTMISPIRYDVEIHAPLSTPVPIPPSISRSDALVIWMLRMAMKAPIMLASTAIHAVRPALSRGTSAMAGAAREARGTEMCAVVDMGEPANWHAIEIAASILAEEGGSGATVAGLGVDRRDYRHARAQYVGGRLRRVENDLHGDALHHLCEVARGIVRRQQRKLLTTCRGQTVDAAPEAAARIHINADRNGLSGPDVRQLRLLVVGDDIGGICRDQRHQLRARLNVLADTQRSVTDNRVRGGN